MNYVHATKKFVQWMQVKGLAESTVSNYSSQVRSFGQHFKDVDRFRNMLSEQANNTSKTRTNEINPNDIHSTLPNLPLVQLSRGNTETRNNEGGSILVRLWGKSALERVAFD